MDKAKFSCVKNKHKLIDMENTYNEWQLEDKNIGNTEPYQFTQSELLDFAKYYHDKQLNLGSIKNCGVLEKAQQMQKEQKYIYSECDWNYEENTIYQQGILDGIDRIVKLIERHCS